MQLLARPEDERVASLKYPVYNNYFIINLQKDIIISRIHNIIRYYWYRWYSVKLRRFLAFYGFSPLHTETCISVTGPDLRTILEGDNHSYVAIFGGDQTQKPHLEKRANLSKLPGFLNLTPKIFTKNTSWLFPISQWEGCTDFLMHWIAPAYALHTSMRCRWLSCKHILHTEQLLQLHPSSCNFLNPEAIIAM